MDKWLEKSRRNEDDPEPNRLNFSSATSNSTDEINIDDQEPIIKKKSKLVRKFNENWPQMSAFKDWLVKKMDINGRDMAFCKVCSSILNPHLTELKRHCLSAKHLQNTKQLVRQTSVCEGFQLSTLTEQTRIAEIKLTALFASNNLPFSLSDTLKPLLSSIFTDSKIAKNLSLKRTKTTAIMKNVLGNSFLNELCDLLKQPCSFYSIIMDETTDISEKKQCALVIIYFDIQSMTVKTQFLDMVETSSGTADHLTDTLLKCITDKNISTNMFVGFSSDTCNVMAGSLHSVFTNLRKVSPSIACIKCSCHMIHLSASKACLKLPRTIEDVLRNIGSHFSRSHSRQVKYKEFQNFFQVEIHKILSPCTTRWLSLKACVDRILEQYPALKEYFRLVNFEDPSKTTEQICNTLDNSFTIIYLEFMSYNLGLLTSFNTLFQGTGPLLYLLKPEIEKLLKTIILNFMNIFYIKNIDSIMNVSPHITQYHLPINEIYIGVRATESITVLKNNKLINSNEIVKFYKSCQDFYIEIIMDIKNRFIFDDPVFYCVMVTNPNVVKEFKIKSLAHVLKRFPILSEHINSPQELDKEWRELALMDLDSLYINSNNIMEFWRKVFLLKNAIGETYFPNIFIIMRLLLVLPFSNASVERLFSDLKNIKTIHRNKLSNASLVGILRTKDSVQDCVSFKPTTKMIKSKTWDIPKTEST